MKFSTFTVLASMFGASIAAFASAREAASDRSHAAAATHVLAERPSDRPNAAEQLLLDLLSPSTDAGGRPDSATDGGATLECGDSLLAHTVHTSYPPVCGATGIEAQANAAAQVIRLLKRGYLCDICPIPKQCTLEVETFADGWFLSTPTFDTILCPNKFGAYASYSGYYIVYCTSCIGD